MFAAPALGPMLSGFAVVAETWRWSLCTCFRSPFSPFLARIQTPKHILGVSISQRCLEARCASQTSKTNSDITTRGDPLASRPRLHPMVLLPPRNLSQQHPPPPLNAPPQTQPKPKHQLSNPNRPSRSKTQRPRLRRPDKTIRNHDQRPSRPIHKRLHRPHLRNILLLLRSLPLGLRPLLRLQHR